MYENLHFENVKERQILFLIKINAVKYVKCIFRQLTHTALKKITNCMISLLHLTLVYNGYKFSSCIISFVL